MTDYIKRIQSRLSRQGIKIEKPALKEEVQILGYSNATLTSELSDLVTEKLLDKFKVVEELTVNDNLLEPILQLEISDNLVNVHGINEILQPLNNEQESALAPVERQELVVAEAPLLKSIKETLNQQVETPIEEEVSTITHLEESIESFQNEQDEVSAMSTTGYAYALAEKSDLVTATAQNMGIELQLNEVQSIASDLDYSGDSLEEGISDIESAITAFVEYKGQANQEKINRMISQVRSTVSQRNAETSQQLNNGLKQIAKDIQQGNTDFKSSVRSALKCFAVPKEKTG